MKIPHQYIHFILCYSLSEPKFIVMYFDTSLLFLLHENMHYISSLVNKRGSMNSFFLLVYFKYCLMSAMSSENVPSSRQDFGGSRPVHTVVQGTQPARVVNSVHGKIVAIH